jgi:hypothetical protein
MIEHYFDASPNSLLWQEYVDINYGRAVREKGYKGFSTFIKDVTNAYKVEGRTSKGFTLYFDSEKSYTWFLLKWSS